jgi:hypothetical protein
MQQINRDYGFCLIIELKKSDMENPVTQDHLQLWKVVSGTFDEHVKFFTEMGRQKS